MLEGKATSGSDSEAPGSGWVVPTTHSGPGSPELPQTISFTPQGCAGGRTGPCLRDEETEAHRDNMLSQWQRSGSTALVRVNLSMVTINWANTQTSLS